MFVGEQSMFVGEQSMFEGNSPCLWENSPCLRGTVHVCGGTVHVCGGTCLWGEVVMNCDFCPCVWVTVLTPVCAALPCHSADPRCLQPETHQSSV